MLDAGNAAPIRRMYTAALLMGLAGTLSGCATGQDYEIGQRAERNQEPHVAYDAYCRAAAKNPDNGTIKSAIKRVTPKAADYWEKQGHLAAGEKRYADAWRNFMHVLEIRPDHPSAGLVIRQLEQQHPTEVAYARQEFEQRGARSLVASGQGAGQTQVAQSGSTPYGRTATADLGSEDDIYVPPSRVRGTPPPPPPPPTAGKYGPQTGAGSSSAVTASPMSPMPSSSAPIPYNPPAPRYAQTPTPFPPTAPMATAPPMTANAGQPTGFMVVRTLSKEDRRYARRREFVDGVAIRIDDVDDDEADLELFMGGIRIAEIKGIRINESARFVGQTGRQFRLIVLDIRESTETVRIGVSPIN